MRASPGAEKSRSALHPEKPWFLVIGRGFNSRHLHHSWWPRHAVARQHEGGRPVRGTPSFVCGDACTTRRCGPCKRFGPVYEAASDQHADIVFGKVDTEAEQALAGAAGITSIPTLMAFRDGILVFAQPGALPAPALEQVIAGVRGLDMDEVRQQIEAEASAEASAGPGLA